MLLELRQSKPGLGGPGGLLCRRRRGRKRNACSSESILFPPLKVFAGVVLRMTSRPISFSVHTGNPLSCDTGVTYARYWELCTLVDKLPFAIQ